MKRLLVILLSLCWTLGITHAQHEYTFVGDEINSVGLRVVGNYIPTGWRKNEALRYGCIDSEGKEIIPIKYEKIILGKDLPYILAVNPFDGETLFSEDAKQCYIDKRPIIVSPQSFRNFKCVVVGREKKGVMNSHSEMLVPSIYDYLFWVDEKKGYLSGSWNGKWNIIDYKGNVIKNLQYTTVKEGKDGILLVEDSNGNWGAINIKGDILIPFSYSDLFGFNGWTMWAKKGSKCVLLSLSGKVLTSVKYNHTHFSIESNGVQSVITNYYGTFKNAKKYYFDDSGIKHMSLEETNIANRNIRKLTNNNLDYALATLTWNNNNSEAKEKEYKLSLLVKSNSKIEDVNIAINGTQDKGIKKVKSNNYDLTINRTLTLNEGVNVIKVSVRNAAGTTLEEKTIVYRPQGGELPHIEWLDFAATAKKKEYQMKLGIKSKSKVEEVNVAVNGNLSRGIKTISADGYDLTVDRTLSLSEGVNRIVVSVRNGDGIATSEKVITYKGNVPMPVVNEKRIALIIGNSNYSSQELNLTNPKNDAQDVANKLKDLGFEVVLKLDATLENIDKTLTAFGEKAKNYDVAMFFYAGHGIQSRGVNYLIPTNIENLAEDNLKYKCVDMERVLDTMEDSGCKLKIVILDACRNNPLSRRWHRSAGSRGLSIMNAPTGTIISFSTSPGSTALDGTGRNSPYTEAFLNTLEQPNLDVFHFFQRVGASVLDKTQRAQNPWLSVSFTGDFYFNKQP